MIVINLQVNFYRKKRSLTTKHSVHMHLQTASLELLSLTGQIQGYLYPKQLLSTFLPLTESLRFL